MGEGSGGDQGKGSWDLVTAKRECGSPSHCGDSVFVGTWNVNAKQVENLEAWFTTMTQPDIIAVGYVPRTCDALLGD